MTVDQIVHDMETSAASFFKALENAKDAGVNTDEYEARLIKLFVDGTTEFEVNQSQ